MSASKRRSDQRKLIVYNQPLSSLAEQFRILVENIELMGLDQKIHSILITSADPNSGKSLISSNLAIAFAQKGKKTLLLDADLRKPTIQNYFDASRSEGLMGVMRNNVTLDEAMIRTDMDGLDVLCVGLTPINPASILATKRFAEVLEELKGRYDQVILDTPPILTVADAQVLAPHVDASLLVIRNDYTVTDRAKKASDQLRSSSKQFLGAIFNNQKQKKEHYYYKEHS
ncbi:CpsD/CapB family tyrosine-protein kinase [Listeria rocourtiae]|uniref:CpsD/CapB family tyrosine-protein kinase n=1 Tax=Listeria rocourtiae TaxID=647910 RepID=UPI003D2F9B59